jgi:hypothetical protein
MSLIAKHFTFLEFAESRNVDDNNNLKLGKPGRLLINRGVMHRGMP